LELSGGKLNLTASTEELSNTQDLMRTNKRMSNKIQQSSNNNGKSKIIKPGKKPFVKNNNNPK